MGVKYVRDFEFPASAGFRDSAMPAKARASERGMPATAKKGVAKLARGGTPMAPGSKAFLGRMPGAKDYTSIPNPLRGLGIGSAYIPRQTNEQRQRLEAVHKGSRTNAFTGLPNPDYDPAYDPAFEEARRESEYAKGGKVSKVGKVMREYKAGKLHSGKSGKVVKNPKQAMAIALSEARKSGEKVVKKSRGGPTTRVPVGPTAPRYGYLPNPFGQDIRYKKGPSGVSFPKKATTNPRDIFGNENPDFNRELAEYEEAMRQQQPRERARGGMVAKRANGGMMSKGPATRGTPAKGRAQGRMDFAEKYAPGLSIDMPGKRVKKK